MNSYFKSVTPYEDYTLSIVFENDNHLEISMLNALNQIRFSPLKDKNIWMNLDTYPTHLEWNKGLYQVTLNIEEILY
jgi:hypothetical protein